jgi:hypothetical protein
MFARVKKSGNHQYLQIVENRKEIDQLTLGPTKRRDRNSGEINQTRFW